MEHGDSHQRPESKWKQNVDTHQRERTVYGCPRLSGTDSASR